MSLKIVFLLLGLSGLVGAAIGYVFRWLLVLSRKGSIEVEIRQILFNAREEAKKITVAAEEEGKQRMAAAQIELKEEVNKVARQEERVFKREETLDKKQQELDREVDAIKARIEDVKAVKERADALLAERAGDLLLPLVAAREGRGGFGAVHKLGQADAAGHGLGTRNRTNHLKTTSAITYSDC